MVLDRNTRFCKGYFKRPVTWVSGLSLEVLELTNVGREGFRSGL